MAKAPPTTADFLMKSFFKSSVVSTSSSIFCSFSTDLFLKGIPIIRNNSISFNPALIQCLPALYSLNLTFSSPILCSSFFFFFDIHTIPNLFFINIFCSIKKSIIFFTYLSNIYYSFAFYNYFCKIFLQRNFNSYDILFKAILLYYLVLHRN